MDNGMTQEEYVLNEEFVLKHIILSQDLTACLAFIATKTNPCPKKVITEVLRKCTLIELILLWWGNELKNSSCHVHTTTNLRINPAISNGASTGSRCPPFEISANVADGK